MEENGSQELALSATVIRNVADEKGVEPNNVESELYNSVDPDALELLCTSMDEGSIMFEYSGYEVTVTSDEAVTVTEIQ